MEVKRRPDVTSEEEGERPGIVHICRGDASPTAVALSLCAMERDGFLVQAPGDGVHVWWSAHAHSQQKERVTDRKGFSAASQLGN